MINTKTWAALLLLCLLCGAAEAQKPELAVQKGHLGPITKAQFSPDEKLLATGGRGESGAYYILWDVKTGAFLRRINLRSPLPENSGKSYSLNRFSEDGSQVIGAQNGAFIAVDTYSGAVIKEGKMSELGGTVPIPYRAALRNSGSIVITRNSDEARVFSTPDYRNNITSFAILPDGQRLLTAYHIFREGEEARSFAPDPASEPPLSDTPLKMWDIGSQQEVKLPIRFDPASAARTIISKDGRFVLIEDKTGKVKAWRTSDWSSVAEYQAPPSLPSLFPGKEREAKFLAISPTGDYALYSRAKKILFEDIERYELILIDIASGKRQYLQPQSSFALLSTTMDERNKSLVFADHSGIVYHWNLEQGELRNIYNEGKNSDVIIHAGINRRGNKLMTSSLYYELDAEGFIDRESVNPALRIWDLETGLQSQLLFSEFLEPSDVEPQLMAGKRADEFLLMTRDNTYQLDLSQPTLAAKKSPVPLRLQDVQQQALYSASGIGKLLRTDNPNLAFFFPRGRMNRLGYAGHFFLLDHQRRKVIKIKTETKIAAADLSADGQELLLITEEKRSSVTAIRLDVQPLLQRAGTLLAQAGDADTYEVSLNALLEQGALRKVSSNKTREFAVSAAYAQKGSRYLTGGYEGNVYLVAADNERTLLGQHAGPVAHIAFFQNDRFAVSSAIDAEHKIWDLNTKQLAATLHLFPEEEGYVITTPDGRFDGNESGFHYVSYIVNYQQEYDVITLDQLKERYYEPGLLAKVLGVSEEPMRTVSAFGQVKLFPKVALQLRGQMLEVKLTARNGGIGRVALYAGDKEIAPDINPGRKATVKVDLAAYAGFFSSGQPMTVGVKAWNADDWLESRKYSIPYGVKSSARGDGPSSPLQLNINPETRLFALCIGTSNYTGETFDLSFADQDAQKVAQTIQSAGRSLLYDDASKISVRLLNTQQKPEQWPSKNNIREAMQAIAREAQPEDLFILYLSGHGTTNDRDGRDYFYYLTHELNSGNINDTEIRKQYAISTAEFSEWLNTIPAQKQVLMLDACASGTFNESFDDLLASRNIPASQIRALDRLRSRTGLFIISGSTADQVSYEASPFGQGLLTYSILQGIKGGEALREGQYVDVLRMFDYAKEKVPQLAQQIGGVQQPMILTPYGSESYDIGKATARVRENIQLAEPKPMFSRVRISNQETLDDDLGIETILNEHLRDFSRQGENAPLIFVDVNKGLNTYRIVGGYSINGDTILLKARVLRDGQTIGSPFQVEGTKKGLPELGKKAIQTAYKQLED